MSIPKIMGIETEFRFDVSDAAESLVMKFCSDLVRGVGESFGVFLANKYGGNQRLIAGGIESEVKKRVEDVSLRQAGFSGFYLPNGMRVYLENSFVPEISTPECLNALDLVVWEKAAERMIALVSEELSRRCGREITVSKNNSDGFGNSYGGHENYLLDPQTFDKLVEVKPSNYLNPYQEIWMSFLISRQIFAGSGKVGAENNGPFALYQLSQRADFFDSLIGLRTTSNRPLINTRDTPYADHERFRRFHVIFGDSSMSEFSSFLKTGTAAIVLAMLEDNFLFRKSEAGTKLLPIIDKLVKTSWNISRDLTCKKPVRLKEGNLDTPIGVQRAFLDAAREWHETAYKSEYAPDKSIEEVLRLWQETLDFLATDPEKLNNRLDNRIKLSLIDSYLDKYKCSREEAARKTVRIAGPGGRIKEVTIFNRLQALDLAYHDLRAGGIFRRLSTSGKIQRLISDAEIENAILNPPSDTRAYLRGEIIRKFFGDICWSNWRRIVSANGKEIRLDNPLEGKNDWEGRIVSGAKSFSDLIF